MTSAPPTSGLFRDGAEKEPEPLSRGERTRRALIDAAFTEIRQNGYRAASLADILEAAGATKGSLYHHFPDKHALGLAAVEDHVEAYMARVWFEPVAEADDPIDALKRVLVEFTQNASEEDRLYGCPINNLVQEMAPLDEAFRHYLDDVLTRWRMAIARALKRGQSEGTVRTDIDAQAAAAAIVALHQGTVGAMKTTRDDHLAETALAGVFFYLDHLRPSPPGAAETSETSEPFKDTAP